MKTIVVCGHSRKVGKTAVTAGLIQAFAAYPWTAIKLSSHWHADVPASGVCSIHEEISRDGASDSSRFLAAGAARSFWIRVREDNGGDAMAQLLPILQSNPFVIVESNWILRYIQPDIRIMVLRHDVEDFKDSAREILARADAVVAINRGSLSPLWSGFAREAMAGIPQFEMKNPLKIPAGLVELVGAKIRD